jgi:hypothetical protein
MPGRDSKIEEEEIRASHQTAYLKGLSHEIDFKNFDKNLQNLAYLRDAAGF